MFSVTGLFTSEGIEEFENDFQKLSDDEIGEDDRVKEDGVDTIEEEKQDDEAEEKDQVAGELVKKQGARKRQFKPTVGAGGTSVLRMVQAELANAKEITLNSWRRRVHQTPNKGHQKPSFMNQVNLLEWLCQQVMGMVSVFKLLIFLISSMSTLVSSVLGVGMVSFLFCYACWYPISHVLRMQWNKIYVLDCLVWCFLERNDIKRISRWLSLRIEDWHQWIIILLLDFVGFILGLFSVSEKWMCLVSSNQTQVRSPYTYSKFYGNMPIIGVYSGQQRAQPNRYYDFYVCILVVIAMRFGGPHMFTDWRKNGIVGYFFLLLVLINHYGDCYILFNVVLYWCLVICWKICEKLESWCFLWMFQGKFLWDREIVKLISLKALTCWRAYLLWGLENSGYHYTQFSQLKGAFLYIF